MVCVWGGRQGGSQYNHSSRNGPMCSNAAFTVSLSTIKAATKNREEGVVWGGGVKEGVMCTPVADIRFLSCHNHWHHCVPRNKLSILL